jgi:hypothetical protein
MTTKAEAMKECNKELQNAGKPYPRTCALCGFRKPCVKGLITANVPSSEHGALVELAGFWWAEVGGEVVVVEYKSGTWFMTGSDSPVSLDKLGPRIDPPA